MAHYYGRYPQTTSSTAKIIILLGFAMIIYMLYALTTKIYDNYLIDQHIQNFSQKNQALKEENSQKLEDLQYYSSNSYIEKIAKQNLGLINNGEEVIIITESANPAFSESKILENEKIERLKEIPNYQKWWRFFFIENQYK